MAALTTKQKIISLHTHGKFGFPSSLGNALCGFNALGAEDELCGVYQGVTLRKGKSIQIQRFYFPTNPNSTAQAARRAVFAAGVSAYRALTPTQLADINRLGKGRRITGYNYFLSKYLRAH